MIIQAIIFLAILKVNHYIDISKPAAPLLRMRNSAGFFYLWGHDGIY